MSTLSQFVGSGSTTMPFEQEFFTSGTFTPSAKLLAAGGRVEVLLVGGGGGYYFDGTSSHFGGGGGEVKNKIAIVSGAINVLIGAPGVSGNATNGGNSDFGALITASGGYSGNAAGLLRSKGGPGGGSGGYSVGTSTSEPGQGTNGFSGGGSTASFAAGGNSSGLGSGAGRVLPAQPGYCRVRWYE